MSRHAPFDGGLSLPYRTMVRNAVIARLEPLLRANEGFLATIVKLPGRLQRLDDEGSAKLFMQVLGRAPAIGVACGDRTGQSNSHTGKRALTFLDVHIYFLNNSGRSLMARIESDVVSAGDGDELEPNAAADPGLDVAMQCAEELLTGEQLERAPVAPPAAPAPNAGTGVIRHLEFKREEEIVTSNQVTVWEQTYTVGVSRSIDRTRGVLRLLGIDTTIHPPGVPLSPARIEFSTEIEEPPP